MIGGVVILDMDGTLLSKRSIDVFCEKLGLEERLTRVDSLSASLPAYRISEMIADFFTGLRRNVLEELFDSIPLNEGVDEFISFLKSKKFLVAIATDSYQFLAERLSRRIGADAFSGNIVEIRNDRLTGRLLTPKRCLKIEGCRRYLACKLWFMRSLRDKVGGVTIAIGDGESDFCVMSGADIGIAYRPRSQSIIRVAKTVASDFQEVTSFLQRELMGQSFSELG